MLGLILALLLLFLFTGLRLRLMLRLGLRETFLPFLGGGDLDREMDRVYDLDLDKLLDLERE